MGIGLLMETGTLPSNKVQAGSEVSQHDKDLLILNSIVSIDDQIEYFYSEGFSSILEGGSILTDDRVILYLPGEDQRLEVYEIYFDDVSSIELLEAGSILSDSIYKIDSYKSDSWLAIALSVENGGDLKFIEALRAKIANATP